MSHTDLICSRWCGDHLRAFCVQSELDISLSYDLFLVKEIGGPMDRQWTTLDDISSTELIKLLAELKLN